MGLASTYEDILKRFVDCSFCEHEIDAELKALLIAPVENRPKKRKVAISHQTHQTQALLKFMTKLAHENEALSNTLRLVQADLAAEKLHVTQLRDRGVVKAASRDAIENRRLRAELKAKKAELKAKDEELHELRILVMKQVVGGNG